MDGSGFQKGYTFGIKCSGPSFDLVLYVEMFPSHANICKGKLDLLLIHIVISKTSFECGQAACSVTNIFCRLLTNRQTYFTTLAPPDYLLEILQLLKERGATTFQLHTSNA